MTGINEENLMSQGTELPDDELEGVVGGRGRPVEDYRVVQARMAAQSQYRANNPNSPEVQAVMAVSAYNNAQQAQVQAESMSHFNQSVVSNIGHGIEKMATDVANHMVNDVGAGLVNGVAYIGGAVVHGVEATLNGVVHNVEGIAQGLVHGDVSKVVSNGMGIAGVVSGGVGSVAVAVGTNAFADGNSTVSSVGNAVRVGVQVATGHGAEGMLSSVGITNNATLSMGVASAASHIINDAINHPTPAPAAHVDAPAAHAPTPAIPPTVNPNNYVFRRR